MKLATLLIVLSTLILVSIFWFIGYRSAFEADQACHESLQDKRVNYQEILGCDHDTETRQWILYKESSENEAAKVIKRFKY